MRDSDGGGNREEQQRDTIDDLKAIPMNNKEIMMSSQIEAEVRIII
jgi:hypothetical protein